MFISNNRTSFHFERKDDLEKHQSVQIIMKVKENLFGMEATQKLSTPPYVTNMKMVD